MCAAPAAAKHLIEMERLAVWIAFNLSLHCIKSNKCEIIEDDNFRPKYFITIFSTTVTYSVDNCNIARRPKLTYYWMLFVNCSWQTFWDGTAQFFMRSRSSVTWTRMRTTVTAIVNTETALSAFCSPRLQTNWTELYKCCRATFYGSPAKGGGSVEVREWQWRTIRACSCLDGGRRLGLPWAAEGHS